MLKDGMARANNESYWTIALSDAQEAVVCENWEVLRCAVGKLFKTLEVTLNKSLLLLYAQTSCWVWHRRGLAQ